MNNIHEQLDALIEAIKENTSELIKLRGAASVANEVKAKAPRKPAATTPPAEPAAPAEPAEPAEPSTGTISREDVANAARDLLGTGSNRTAAKDALRAISTRFSAPKLADLAEKDFVPFITAIEEAKATLQ